MGDARPGLFSLNRTLSRGAYAATGIVLMAVKYGIDRTIAAMGHRTWDPWSYFMWPGAETVGVAGLSTADRRLALSLLLIALPFVVAGVILTVQRLRAVDLPLPFVILFFVPLLNVALFFVLLFAPDARRDNPRPPAELPRPKNWDAQADELWRRGRGFGRAASLAWIVSVPATFLLLLVGVTVLKNYGWGVFVGVPFLLGFLSVVVFTRRGPRSWHDCVMVMLGSIGLTALTILLVAFEGIVCLLMALPIALVLSWFGAFVAYTIQRQRWNASRIASLCLTLFALAPALMAAERADAPAAELRAVVTKIVVAAPAELVWKRVVSFPPIPPPHEWLFAAGVAAPLAAEIDGAGAGAVRRCLFTTGAFVEPIDVWDEPHLLHFAVTGQPPPMKEWSPYQIHPPHLDGFLVSRAGQFRIEPLAGGRTLLEGTTWYENRMWPAAYWSLWSDAFIHAIHRRVLDHVGALAEEDARANDRSPRPR
jgi:FtsH-binding integral membrane protein